MRNQVVSHEDWLKARLALLAAEKEFTRQREALTRQRMAMPWERVGKAYRFDGPEGVLTLEGLFAGRSQLLVYHFMLGPDWQEGCKSCSFWADNFNGIPVHLAQRDVTFTAISRAPLEKIDAYRRRMGWSFPWVSSGGSDFNFDYQASATPQEQAAGRAYYNFEICSNTMSEMVGVSVFYRSGPVEVHHTQPCYACGVEMVNGAHHVLDLVPKGRDDEGLRYPMQWVKRHDQY